MIIDKVRQELAKYDKPQYKLDYQRFFKEKLKERYGLKTSIVRKISNQCFKEIKDRPKQEIFEQCEKLLESGVSAERSITFEWAFKVNKYYAKSDFKRFESWLKKHVHSWASCDHLCCNALGHLVFRYPELTAKTKRWTKSKNRWLRRASAVSLIVSAREKQSLRDIFQTADMLLVDDDDMVQKGYGWMLKEASNNSPDEIFSYVIKHKKTMPRTALRYAIEKLPANMRKEAMKKDR